jgi:hypothetical protein
LSWVRNEVVIHCAVSDLGEVRPSPLQFSKSFISARCAIFILQNRHNKGVIYQNRHNKELNPNLGRFRPVFVGKIVQIKELCIVKELSPGISGAFFCTASILSSGRKLMGTFIYACKPFIYNNMLHF